MDQLSGADSGEAPVVSGCGSTSVILLLCVCACVWLSAHALSSLILSCVDSWRSIRRSIVTFFLIQGSIGSGVCVCVCVCIRVGMCTCVVQLLIDNLL